MKYFDLDMYMVSVSCSSGAGWTSCFYGSWYWPKIRES